MRFRKLGRVPSSRSSSSGSPSFIRRHPVAVAVAVPLLIVLLGWWSRGVIARLFPIHHEGVVLRIQPFSKSGPWGPDRARQRYQFAIVFEDGFDCEGYDTSLAAVKPGDRIRIKGYHDVQGKSFLDPEWMECDEAQLVRIVVPAEKR